MHVTRIMISQNIYFLYQIWQNPFGSRSLHVAVCWCRPDSTCYDFYDGKHVWNTVICSNMTPDWTSPDMFTGSWCVLRTWQPEGWVEELIQAHVLTCTNANKRALCFPTSLSAYTLVCRKIQTQFIKTTTVLWYWLRIFSSIYQRIFHILFQYT